MLTRIAGLFARRGFNIETLTVGPTADDRLSRVTLTVDGAVHPIDQVTKQLHKLVNVLKIRDLEPAGTVTRELALFKVAAEGPARSEVLEFTEIFRGRVVDTTKRSLTIEVTGGGREDQRVRAGRPAVRAGRDDAHRRDRDVARSLGDVMRRRADGAARERAVRAPDASRDRLAAQLRRAVARRAPPRRDAWRRSAGGSTAGVDPSAVVLASRRAGEPWMCFEQPDRERSAVAALGAAVALEDRGHRRFERVAARWRDLVARAHVDRGPGRPGAGWSPAAASRSPPTAAARRTGRGFAPASLIVREVDARALAARRSGAPSPSRRARRRRRRAARSGSSGAWRRCASGRCRCSIPHPTARHVIAGRDGARALRGGGRARRRDDRARAAREDRARARGRRARAGRARRARGLRRAARGVRGCFVYAVGRGDGGVHRRDARAAAAPQRAARQHLALAGSIGRSADPAVDDHLGERLLHSRKDREEHAIVARRIERTLRPHAVWVTRAEEPEVVRVANIQHLATPIRAQLAAPVAAVELAGLLHPTPAVGGEPRRSRCR